MSRSPVSMVRTRLSPSCAATCRARASIARASSRSRRCGACGSCCCASARRPCSPSTSTQSLYVALATLLMSRRPRIVALVNTSTFYRSHLWKRIYQVVLARFDLTVHGSDAQRHFWLKANSAAWHKSTVVYNGVDSEHFEITGAFEAGKRLRATLGVQARFPADWYGRHVPAGEEPGSVAHHDAQPARRARGRSPGDRRRGAVARFAQAAGHGAGSRRPGAFHWRGRRRAAGARGARRVRAAVERRWSPFPTPHWKPCPWGDRSSSRTLAARAK